MRALWLLALAAGCGAAPAVVDVGTGIDRFVVIHDGDSVPIIMGLQGGYHIWGSVRADNLAATGLKLRFALTNQGQEVTVRSDTVDLMEGEHLGTAVFLPDPEAVRGKPCSMSLQVTDPSGRRATAEHLLVPQ